MKRTVKKGCRSCGKSVTVKWGIDRHMNSYCVQDTCRCSNSVQWFYEQEQAEKYLTELEVRLGVKLS